MNEVSIDQIKPSPYQPRLYFDLEAIKESIKKDGMLVAPLVRGKSDGKTEYELIDGERRWRASKELGWKKIPIEIKNVDDETARRMVYILNEERQPYTLEENTKFFRRMYDQMGSAYAVAEAFGRHQSTIWQYINISILPEHFQKALWARKITTGFIQELEPLFTEARNEIGDIARYTEYQKSPTYQRIIALCERIYTGDIKTPKELRKEYVDPYLESLDKKRLEKVKEEVEKVVPQHLIEAKEVKLETPEELERTAEVLRKEAKRKREEILTPEEKAEQERNKEEKKRRSEETKKHHEEEQTKRIEQEVKKRASGLEETERHRIEEEARKKAKEELFKDRTVLKEAAVRYSEVKRTEREEARSRLEQAVLPMEVSEADLVNKVIIGDAKDVLRSVPASSIDMVVTSPPYFGLKDYGDELGINTEDLNRYLDDLKAIFAECFRVLKDGTFICVVIGQYTSEENSQFVPAQVAHILEEIGFNYKREHIWVKPLGIQGIWNRGTTSFLQKPYPRNTMINIHHEHILIYQKGDKPTIFYGRNPLTEEEVKQYCWSVWELGVSDIKDHPAPYPEVIPFRLIKMYSYEGEVVLDPFLGSGTTVKVAKKLKRRSIGIEVSPEYLDIIKRSVGGADFLYHDGQKKLDFNYLTATVTSKPR
jgi:ParB/RepB/Spo0J family partition protein